MKNINRVEQKTQTWWKKIWTQWENKLNKKDIGKYS